MAAKATWVGLARRGGTVARSMTSGRRRRRRSRPADRAAGSPPSGPAARARSTPSGPPAASRTRTASTARTRSPRCAPQWPDLEPGTETDRRGQRRRADHAQARHRQARVRHDRRARRRDPAVRLQGGHRRRRRSPPSRTLDRGDWVGVHGTVMTTRAGELSVKVDRLELLAKSLRPLPDKWHGLSDPDTRFRQRYVDLVVNAEARRAFDVRHEVIASFRRTFREPRLHRGRDAGAARRGRRRPRPPVRHPPQHARHAAVPAHRARAAPQAADRRRHGPGVRDRPGVPQRGPRRHGTTPSSR